MRNCFVLASFVVLTSLVLAQQTTGPTQFGEGPPAKLSADSTLKDLFQARIKAEWEALKNKDKKAFGDLLADDYQGVETAGSGERNKLQAINAVPTTTVFNYTFRRFKLIPLD